MIATMKKHPDDEWLAEAALIFVRRADPDLAACRTLQGWIISKLAIWWIARWAERTR